MVNEANIIDRLDFENMFISYIKKVIINARKKFDRANNAHIKNEELGVNETVHEFLDCTSTTSDDITITLEEYIEIDPLRLETVFTDIHMYKAVKVLTPKQKYILYFSCVKDMSDQTIAELFGTSRQAINKLKKAAINRVISKHITANTKDKGIVTS